MSQYAYLICEQCKSAIFLGQAVMARDNASVFYFHRGPAGAVKNANNEILNKAIWKMLAEHVNHSIRVVLEYSIDPETWKEMTRLDEPSLEAYIGDWID